MSKPDQRNIYLEDIPIEMAQERLYLHLQQAARDRPLESESVALLDALGRITAEPVWAKLSSPHYHAAAMDGYATLAKNTHNATETRPIQLTINIQAFPVNTGDPLPPNTDAIIMIEDVQHIGDNAIEIRRSLAPWKNVRAMGEDMVATELVLPVNHQIRPVDLGAIAGCGHHQVSVRRKPKVIIIPTGNELVAATQMPSSGEIIEYNSLILRGQIVEYGGEASITDIIRDDADLLKQAIEDAKAQNPDLILMLSGSSAGSRDFTASVVREMGELLVHGVAARPGHPVIIGIIDAIPVIGVPGYPVSATLTGEIFIQPLIQKWLGIEIDPRPIVEAVMTRKLISPTGDDDFVRVTLARVGERLLATPLNSGAGVITSLVRADGLAQIPRFSEGVDMGGLVNVKLYRPMSVIENTIMAMGSHDPLLDVLGQFLATEYPDYRLASVNVGSLGGLIALKRKEAHLAGVHLLDTETGDYNISYIKQYLPDEPIQLVTFAHREQGLIVAEGNPLNIQSLDDLSRIRYVNRQRGAGTRVLLDYELEKRGISSELISGYDHEEYTHLAVAAAIASGMADCGMGVRRAAVAMNLDFISVGWERYDLAIPNQYSNDESIYRLLEILRSENFKQELGAHPGYESSLTGTIHTFDQ